MDVKDFIAETLVGIVDGIKEAQGSISSSGARVNPQGFQIPYDQLNGRHWNKTTGETLDSIEFDIALMAVKASKVSQKLEVVMGSEAGKAGVTRVKFSVPVKYPVQRN